MKLIQNVTENLNKLLIFISILLFSISALAINGRTTYQAKIIKPDGYPLEASTVNYRFTVLDPTGSCVLYIEDYANVNMNGSGGLISLTLGMGTKAFPVSGTLTFASAFDNSTPTFNCQTPGAYNPIPTDNRKVVMQFNDGAGWQTLPAMAINAVPYAMYAAKSQDSQKLNGKADSAFVENATLAALNCNAATHAITFNGASFSCIAVGSGGGGGGITSVTASGSVLTMGGTASAPVISITAATMSQDGYLTSLDYAEFKAKLSASSTQLVSALGFAPVSSSAVAAQIDSSAVTSATANSIVKRDSSGNSSFAGLSANTASLNYVDIYRPSTSFNIRLQAPTSLSANYTLNLPTTSGTTGQVLSTDGLGNLSWINSATGSVSSVSGTLNEITSSGGSTPVLGLANVGAAGTYFKVITDNKGRVTSGVTTLTLSDLPATVLNTTSNFSGDISGMISNITVNRIQGVSVTVSSLTTNDILQFDGTKYVNKNIPTCAGTQYLTFNGTGFTCVADSGASGTITTISVTGPISSTGGSNPTLSITQAGLSADGYLSSSDFTTFNNKQNATSAAIIATLGYTPANNAASGTYLQKTSNLSDLTNPATARSNLGLGSLALGNSIDLGSASATGTLATGRIPAFTGDATIAAASNTIILSNSGVAAGTFTKVTVDAKGRVTSSSALASSDVTTALGYVPTSAPVPVASATMVANWPDAIVCDNGADKSILYHDTREQAGDLEWYSKASGSASHYLRFSATTGAFTDNTAFTGFSACAGKSLATLISEGRTFGLLGGGVDWTASGTSIFRAGGNVGIGTTNPFAKLSVSGGLQIGYDSVCNATKAGTLRYNNSTIELCDGTSFVVISTGSGSGSGSGTTIISGWPDAIKCDVTNPNLGTIAMYLTYGPYSAGNYYYRANIENGTNYGIYYNSSGTYLGLESLITTECSGKSIATLYAENKAFNFVGGGSGSGVTLNGSTSSTQTFTNGTAGSAFNISSLNGVHTFNIPLAATNSVTAGLLSNSDYVSFSNKLSTLDLGSVSATGTLAAARLPVFTGDVVSSVGSSTLTLSNTGVNAGTYNKVTVDAKGRVTSSSALSASDVTTALGYTPANSATSVSSQWITSGATINYGGSVGLGATAPSAKLDINAGAGSLATGMKITGYLYSDTSATAIRLSPQLRSAANNDTAIISADGTDFFPGSGNIRSAYGLKFDGSTWTKTTGNPIFNAYAGYFVAPTFADSNYAIFSSGQTVLAASSGNVGIGTASPGQKLTVSGTIESTSGGFRFPDGSIQTTAASSTAGLRGAAVAWVAFDGITGAIQSSFNVNSVSKTASGRYVVNFSQNLGDSNYAVVTGGINTGNADGGWASVANAPIGSGKTVSGVSIASFSNAGAYLEYPETYVVIYQGNGTASLTNLFTENGSNIYRSVGNVGIGTATPTSQLEVSSNLPNGITVSGSSTNSTGLKLLNSASGGRSWSLYSSGGGPSSAGSFGIYDNTSGTARMVIDSNGNVGVGTVTPTAKLEVVGEVKATTLQTATGQSFKILTGTASYNPGTCGPVAGCTTFNVNFGYTFTTPPNVTITGTTWSSWCNLMKLDISSTSTTSVTVGVTNPTAGSLTPTGCTINWQAIGL